MNEVMTQSGPTGGVSRNDVLRFVEQQSSPVTSEEASESLDCSRETLRRHLESLAEAERIGRKRVADATTVWWSADRSGGDGPHDDERFSTFVRAVEDYAIFLLAPDGTVTTWNAGAERIKGYEEEEIVGEHVSTFYTEEAVAEGVPERNLDVAAREGRTEDEGWRVRNDGSRFWANVTITANRDERGELIGFTKVTRDLTERREYEQQLKEQAARLEDQRNELEAELEEVFERVDDAFYALDEELQFRYVNSRAEDHLGKPEDELLGRTPWEAIDVDEDDPIFRQFESALADQEPRTFERYSEPLEMWEIVRVYPSPSGLSVYFRDISDRKERERALRESEQRYRSLTDDVLDTSDVGTFILDSEFEIVWVNEAVERYFELDRDAVLGRDKRAVIEEHIEGLFEDDRAFTERVTATYDDNSYTEQFECHIPGDEGREERWLEHWSQPIESGLYDGGRIEHYTDITERKRYERRLEELVERLNESNERLEQFTYAVSHDLQEPLRMVSSYVELLERDHGSDLDEEATEYLEFALDGADRMTRMIDDLLEYSRVETRGGPHERVDLNAVLEDVRTDLQFHIDEHDAEITVGELPAVSGDRTQLRQLFQNLLENAIEYSGEDPPAVQISATGGADTSEITVRDEGIGIDPEHQDRIFEIFQRLHTHEEHDGTGVGLALCQRIVEHHDGEIEVESESGDGTTFTVSLPTVGED
jgi:PAS domain S-box-containing protein